MDSITDNSLRTLWGIVKAAGAPDYFANGVLVDANDAASLPDSLFADPVNRRFPINDRANTFASAGYFAKTASDCGYSDDQKEAVLLSIKRASEIYGIKDDVESAMSKISSPQQSSQEKQAANDISGYCDPEHRGYPVFDKTGAELANDFFANNAYKYGHERRMSIAKNIMRKCAEYGVEPSEQVRLSSGTGFPNRETLAEHLLFRADELMRRGTYKMAEELCKFAREICICSDEDLFRNRDGLFDAIGGMDEITGLDDLYGRQFYAPEELTFDITPDSMKEIVEDSVPMGHDTFSAKALSGLPRALFEKVLPKEVVDGMMEDGKISPKKLSLTIISLKSPESSHLKKTIQDFTNGAIDVEDEDGDPGIELGGELGKGDKTDISIGVGDEKGRKKDKEDNGGKDEGSKED